MAAFTAGYTKNTTFVLAYPANSRLSKKDSGKPDDSEIYPQNAEVYCKAGKEHFPASAIQRCLVHKERNIRGKLSKRHTGELARLFRRLRSVQGYTAAQEVVGELEAFLEHSMPRRLRAFMKPVRTC
ncbi:Transposase, Mutator family [Aureliella helgolandensis]|uniref:Transposase, Mutator family n=1 Tax=Aureliella helgolandensis TaxID=2527968 RepID=A0A518GBA8_9BACT|nr:Transposase, Mutator family [Aureliella helgolandensis]